MGEDAAKIIGGAWISGCALLMFGLMMSGSSGDAVGYTAANALGEAIGEGIAHAACIEAGGAWRIDVCVTQ
jgi:hypothetical protein